MPLSSAHFLIADSAVSCLCSVQNTAVDRDCRHLPGNELPAVLQGLFRRHFQPAAAGDFHASDDFALHRCDLSLSLYFLDLFFGAACIIVEPMEKAYDYDTLFLRRYAHKFFQPVCIPWPRSKRAAVESWINSETFSTQNAWKK